MSASSGGAHANPLQTPNSATPTEGGGHAVDRVVHRQHEEVVVRDGDGVTVHEKKEVVEMTTGGDVVRTIDSAGVHDHPPRAPETAKVVDSIGPGHKGCILDGHIGGGRTDRGDPVARHRHLLEHSLSRDMGCTSPYYSQYFGQQDIFNRLTDHRFFPVSSRGRFDPATGHGLGLAQRDIHDRTGRPVSPTRKHPTLQWKRPASFESARCLWIFRNGDGHDDGTRYYLKTNLGRYTLKNIYAELSKILKPTGGAIRELYDQKLHRIIRVEQLKDGGCYLACEVPWVKWVVLSLSIQRHMATIYRADIERDMARLLKKEPDSATKPLRPSLCPPPPRKSRVAASIMTALNKRGISALLTAKEEDDDGDGMNHSRTEIQTSLSPRRPEIISIRTLVSSSERPQSGRRSTDYQKFFDKLRETHEDDRDEAQRMSLIVVSMLTAQVKDAYRALNLSYDAEWEKILDRAKSLKHRYKAAGDKRHLARVYKAFSILEADRKKKLYGGDEQLIGRSRRDRELDGMFNHMSKEIAKRRREESEVGGSSSAGRV
ncbi:hypothetical protein FOZ62_022837, partial [Perkinsus olseni]